ncbi:AAA-domain-containing protein [Xylariaceae sp. FL1272]|nr:AAA-domain-containing protein [Xylariaceae sp. FL1272]
MGPKRGRHAEEVLEYNFQLSDPDDDNFDPSADDERQHPRKRVRGARKSRPGGRRGNRYNNSDIDDDDIDELGETEDEGSFHGDDDNEEESPVAEGGRHRRKVTKKQVNYKESSDDDESDSEGKAPRGSPKSKIVTIKVPGLQKKQTAPAPTTGMGTRRSTRARTADGEGDGDLELVELSNSGRHARAAAGSKSRSPEAVGRRRATRGAKGIKKPPALEDVEEDFQDGDEASDNGAVQDKMDVDQTDETKSKADDDEEVAKDAPVETVETVEDADEDDDVPITRRTRAGRHAAGADAEAPIELPPDEHRAGSRRRLTRGSKTRKSAQEASSDFEPGNDSDEDADGQEDGQDEDDGDTSPSGRGAKSPSKSRRSSRRPRRDEASGDEEQLDREEMAEELEDLREDSQSRRTRRRRSPAILFERKERRKVKKVDYSIPPLNQANFEMEEEEGAMPISTPARRRGRMTALTYNSRALHTLAGPFGGASGEGALAEGPWGNGSGQPAGGYVSDSSDEEMNARSGAGHPPTTPRGLSSANAQLTGGDGHGSRVGALAPNVGKLKDQKALADADPLGVDLTVNFSQVGGMQGHIEQLKEMVQLPLLYPEMFARFHVTPPRGVLFHGPPGTGKTLLARALANSIGFGGKKITFYMRKGADALSKWVGEAEKQLRLLFEEARKTQPSIIFFDEIDGLAPVRSSKQEQIHASIVSTLLALMDGMDGRGQVIVIGATNRPDNIDPALRRPGRFDREFYFPLPDVDARKAILDIHTKDWGVSDSFKMSLAKDTKGYGGADLRALCTEAALNSIQRTYPQIYTSKEKLLVDPEKVNVQTRDFTIAKQKIIPSSERSSASGAAPIPKDVEPLLRHQFKSIIERIDNVFPRKPKVTALQEAMFEPYDDADGGFEREELAQEFDRSRIFRPRLLLTAVQGMGQNYLAKAIKHHLEGVSMIDLDLATVLGDPRPAEQVLTSGFIEAKRRKPSVICIPNVDAWYTVFQGPALTAFLGMLRSIDPTEPIMILATAEVPFKELSADIRRDLFGFSKLNLFEISRPFKENREEYFSRIIAHIRRLPKDYPGTNRKKRILEELPVAPPPPPRKLTKEEIHEEDIQYRRALNMMKVHLQPIMDQIAKKYQKFRHPVISEDQYQYLLDEAEPGYVRPDVADLPPRPFELAKDKDGYPGLRATESNKFFYNLDVNIIETRLANGYYWRPYEFLKDVRGLKSDAEAIGDRARWLKASELLQNVEVDVLDVDEKLRNTGINWEAMYETQKKRREEREERARKRKAMQPVPEEVHSDISNGGLNGTGNAHTTTVAQFQVIGDLPNGTTETSSSSGRTNGTTIPSRGTDGDISMADVSMQPSGLVSPMHPPSQWPRMPTHSLDTSTRVTTGGTAQLSHISTVQSLPSDMSPPMANDNSIRTSDPSSRSSNFSTQLTNGGLHDQSGLLENLPDTQSYAGASQTTSSDEQWPHSQAHGIMRGYIQPSGLSQSSQHQMSPSAPRSSQAPSMANLLNDPSPDEPSSQSRSNSQQVELDDGSADQFIDHLIRGSSGCTIEQLEQLNSVLMTKLYDTRGEHNRFKILNTVTRVFNETVEDIDQMQQIQPQSQ